MNLKINREIISVNEKIYDGIQEQNVELDYILPDYYPDIFKMIKSSIQPSINSYSINGDTLTYEIIADVKILYCSENNNGIQCISQRLVFNKTVNLGDSVNNPEVTIIPKSDHINCRVVNKRRIDLRGAVSIKIKVFGESKQEAVSDIFGMNVQMKKIPIECMAKKIIQNKTIALNEDLEMNMSKPPVNDIIRYDVRLSEPDKKIIANKLAVKGDAEIKILYTCPENMETMTFSVPYSQIIDMDGLDESFKCMVKIDGTTCDFSVMPDSNGENRVLKCELKINIKCCAYKTIPVRLVSDVYSTSYPCQSACAKLPVEQAPIMINEKFQTKILIENDGNNISCVYDVWCNIKNINISIDNEEKAIKVSGMLCYQAMVKTENNYPSVIEKESAFEHEIKCDEVTENSTAELCVVPLECTYTLTDLNGISIKADISVNGELFTSSFCEAITDLSVDDTVKITRDGDYALKLYYGVKDEQVWNIAKKYCTSVNAIMEENSLENECLPENGMLLIPIV